MYNFRVVVFLVLFLLLVGCSSTVKDQESLSITQPATPEVMVETQEVVSPTPSIKTIRLETGEEFDFPLQAFENVSTIVAGIESIQVVRNTAGEVEYFLLPEKGYWVAPIEINTNPDNIENYPQISLEDGWDERLLYSEALEARPFPEGTAVPDRFVYKLLRSPLGSHIQLVGWFDESEYNYSDPGFQENINIDNDYKRWIAFYRSTTPNETEVLVATQQMLSADGENSYLIHWIFGEEWNWTRDQDSKRNLIDSLFKAADPNHQGDFDRWRIAPSVYYFTAEDFYNTLFGTNAGSTTAAIELREDERNSLAANYPELEDLFQQAIQERSVVVVGDVDPEVMEWLQRTFQIGITRPIESQVNDYFEP